MLVHIIIDIPSPPTVTICQFGNAKARCVVHSPAEGILSIHNCQFAAAETLARPWRIMPACMILSIIDLKSIEHYAGIMGLLMSIITSFRFLMTIIIGKLFSIT